MTRPLIVRHRAMATEFWLRVVHPEAQYVRQAARAAWDELDRLESLLSRYVGSSDVARLNRLPSGSSATVDPDTYDCLVIAQRVERMTQGAFNVAYRSQPRRPSSDAIRLHDYLPVVRVLGAGVQLDLGGIGKGYALDRTLALLGEWQIERVLLGSSGSTVLAHQPPPGQAGWPVHFGSGAGRRAVKLARRAFSGSGTEVKGQHVLDPGSGRPAPRRQAWAAATSAAEADALSTAFLVMAESQIRALLERHPHVEAWLETASGGARPVHTT